MALIRTADSYAYEAIWNCLTTDPGLIELFNGVAPTINPMMPLRQADMPQIVYLGKVHDKRTLPYQRTGRLYFSVYDYSQQTQRADQICDRICKTLRMRGFPGITGKVSNIRIFENTTKNQIATDTETVIRYDMSFPVSWFDDMAAAEKLTRSI